MKEKIFEILRVVLGDDATGIYCDDAVVEGDFDQEDFYSTVENNGFGFVIEDYVDDTIDISIEHGCTRLVLVPNDDKEDFVIKLPITATYETVYICNFKNANDEDSFSTIELSEADYIYEEEENFESYNDLGELISVEKDFRLIKTLSPDCDLMDEENALLEDANEALKKILIPNEFIGKYNGIPVYIQRKVEKTFNQSRPYLREERLTEKQVSTAKSIMKEVNYFLLDAILINDLIELYGEEETQLILEGIKDLGLDDLHGSNIGYFSDGSIGIIDYAGYNEECVWSTL